MTATPVAITESDECLYVRGEMTIYCAQQLQELLFAAVRARAGAATIDLSAVTEIDTAGLQVLLLAQRVSTACGTKLELVCPSEAVQEAMTLSGLVHLLADAKTEAST